MFRLLCWAAGAGLALLVFGFRVLLSLVWEELVAGFGFRLQGLGLLGLTHGAIGYPKP